jgi:hypothetical protein
MYALAISCLSGWPTIGHVALDARFYLLCVVFRILPPVQKFRSASIYCGKDFSVVTNLRCEMQRCVTVLLTLT